MKKPRLRADEKLRLIELYYESGDSIRVFAANHGLCPKSLCRWLNNFEQEGEKGLYYKSEKTYDKIASQLTTESDLRKEILKLRIENERLKKSYTVRTTEDGKTEYIRLKAKNTK